MARTLDQVDMTLEHTVSADVLVKARFGLSMFIALMAEQVSRDQAAVLAANFDWTPQGLLDAVDALDTILNIETPDDVTAEELDNLLYNATGVRN